MRGTLLRLREYVENSDPLANIAGTIAIILAVNEPFYSIYLYVALGVAAWPAWLALLPVPFYAAVPAVLRRHSLAGRAMLPIVGVANVVLWLKLFGVACGVELYLFVCVLLGVVLPRPGERLKMAAVLALAFIVYLGVGRSLEPVQVLSADAYAVFAASNALAVAILIAITGLLLSSILSDRKV
jgi:hypothetical protein